MFDLKTKYDLIVPFGKWCGPALWLRKFCLRSCSLPFDWMGGDALSLDDYVSIVCDDFSQFMQHDAMKFYSHGNAEIDDSDTYQDIGTGLFSCHDFNIGIPFEDAWPDVRRKFDRRVFRLFAKIENSKHVLFVHIDRNVLMNSSSLFSKEALIEAVEKMRRKFSHVGIDFLVIRHNARISNPTFEIVGQGVYLTVGDYWRPDVNDRYGNADLFRPIFESLRLRGHWKNVMRRRIAQWKLKLHTCMHLTSSERRRAREAYNINKYKMDCYNG